MLQAMLLAQAASVSESSTLPLNGPFGMELGTAGDVLNRDSESPIEISITDRTNGTVRWKLSIPSEDALFLLVTGKPDRYPLAFRNTPRAFTFLSAERLGPRGFSTTSPLPEHELQVGLQGEYSAHVLSVLGNRAPIYPDRAHPLRDEPTLLKYEVEQWLSEITRPIEITGGKSSRLDRSRIALSKSRLRLGSLHQHGFWDNLCVTYRVGGVNCIIGWGC